MAQVNWLLLCVFPFSLSLSSIVPDQLRLDPLPVVQKDLNQKPSCVIEPSPFQAQSETEIRDACGSWWLPRERSRRRDAIRHSGVWWDKSVIWRCCRLARGTMLDVLLLAVGLNAARRSERVCGLSERLSKRKDHISSGRVMWWEFYTDLKTTIKWWNWYQRRGGGRGKKKLIRSDHFTGGEDWNWIWKMFEYKETGFFFSFGCVRESALFTYFLPHYGWILKSFLMLSVHTCLKIQI